MHVKKATHKMHGRGQEMSMSEEINYKKEKRRERLSQKKLERAAAGRKNTKNKKNNEQTLVKNYTIKLGKYIFTEI
jgi:hypothetical protein